MPEQTIHIKSIISKDDLETVISGLEIACGGNRIHIVEAYDLVVHDKRQVTALRALFGPIGRNEMAGQTLHTTEIKKVPNIDQPSSHRAMKSWRVLNVLGMVVEQITVEEKNRRLATGEFEPYTILHHPKAGRQRVTGVNGLPQRLEPS